MTEFNEHEYREINRVVAAAFGHDEQTTLDDTIAHLDEADHVQLHRASSGEIGGVAMYKRYDLLGRSALELAGRCIHPELQAQGIGSRLLSATLDSEQPELVVTYTRNMNVIRMMQRAGIADVYPFDDFEGATDLAMAMPFASMGQRSVIHAGRYGSDGLYGVGYNGAHTAEHLDLVDQGNALIIVGRTE